MTNIIKFTGKTTLPLDPDKVLNNLVGLLDSFVLCGWDKKGEFFISSTRGENEKIVHLLALGMRAALTPEDDV
jgi:hypothetical protein